MGEGIVLASRLLLVSTVALAVVVHLAAADFWDVYGNQTFYRHYGHTGRVEIIPPEELLEYSRLPRHTVRSINQITFQVCVLSFARSNDDQIVATPSINQSGNQSITQSTR